MSTYSFSVIRVMHRRALFWELLDSISLLNLKLIFREIYVLALTELQIFYLSLVEKQRWQDVLFSLDVLGTTSPCMALHSHTQAAGSYGAFRNKQSKLWLQSFIQPNSLCLDFGHRLRAWLSLSQGIGPPDNTILLSLMLHYWNIFLRLFPRCLGVLSLLAWIIRSLKHSNSHLTFEFSSLNGTSILQLKEVVAVPKSQTGLPSSIL